MQFQPIGILAKSGRTLAAPQAAAPPAAPAAPPGAPAAGVLLAAPSPPPPPPPLPPPPATGRQALVETSQNLLKHIPGEASGFYLMAVDAVAKPRLATVGLIFVLSLVLLVVVRWLTNASKGIMFTTILAFLIWMLVLKNGFLYLLLPNLLPDPLGLIVAVFYSTLVTLLASAGKIR